MPSSEDTRVLCIALGKVVEWLGRSGVQYDAISKHLLINYQFPN